ncbi:MAG TPA: helix-turn-helix transcriptional regulator [Paludibacter sp.]
MVKNKLAYNSLKLIDLINRDKRTNIQIGEAVKQHANMVGKIARGDSFPSVDSLAKYAELYGKDINYFYNNESNSETLVVSSPPETYGLPTDLEGCYKIMFGQQKEITELTREVERLKNANAPGNGAKVG